MSGNDNTGVARFEATPGTASASPQKDPFDAFFDALPLPSGDYILSDNPMVPIAFRDLARAVLEKPCEMPEYRKLAQNIIKAVWPHEQENDELALQLALDRLMEFAIALPPSLDDNSNKAQHLRYLRWVACGRKDEESPTALETQSSIIANPVTVENQSSNVVAKVARDYTLLPGLTADEKICANRHSLGELVHCNRCVHKTSDRVTMAVFYCNEKCRQIDHDDHKPTCDMLMQFGRSIDMFNAVFRWTNAAVEDPRDYPMAVSRDQYGMIRAEMPGKKQYEAHALMGSQFLGPVPVKENWEDGLLRPILFKDPGYQISTSMRPVIDFFLHPFVKTIEAVHFFPKNMAEVVYEIKPDYIHFRTADHHTVLRVTLPGGFKVAVDLAGFRYGWKESLAPWEHYAKHRIAVEIEPSWLINVDVPKLVGAGEAEEEFWKKLFRRGARRNLAGLPVGEGEGGRADVKNRVARYVTLLAHADVVGEFGSFGELLALDEASYVCACKNLMERVGSLLGIHATMYWRHKGIRFYMPLEEGGALDGIRVAVRKEEYTMMKNVWLTPEEYIELGPVAAWKEYRRRLRRAMRKLEAAEGAPAGAPAGVSAEASGSA